MATKKRVRLSPEERALRNGKYCFGTGENIRCVEMNDGVGNDGDDVYTIEEFQVVTLEHSGRVIAGVLISIRRREESPMANRQFFLFAFRKNGSNFDLIGASFVGRSEGANLSVLGDGEVHGETLDPEGNIDREVSLNANFFRIRI